MKLSLKLIATALLLAVGANALTAGPGDDETKKKIKKKSVATEKVTPEEFEKIQKKVAVVFEDLLAQKGPAAVCDGKCENEAKCEKFLAWAQENPTIYYAKELGGEKVYLKAVAPLLVDRFAGKKTSEAERAIMLDFVGMVGLTDPGYVGKLWKISPKSFSEDHMLSLASKKLDGMVDELAKRCKKYDQDPEAKNLGPALWFALRGDELGQKTLIRAHKKADYECGCIARPMVAAIGLESLGHEGILEKTRVAVHEGVVSALDAGNVKQARNMTLQAEYFAKVLQKGKGKGVCVVSLQKELQSHCVARATEVATAEAIFDLIEKVSPTM